MHPQDEIELSERSIEGLERLLDLLASEDALKHENECGRDYSGFLDESRRFANASLPRLVVVPKDEHRANQVIASIENVRTYANV